MKVLKFGGTSVGSAQNIVKTIDIINNSKDKQVVVVSALGGITNKLVNAIRSALNKDNQFKKIVTEIHKIHLETIQKLNLNNSELTIFLDKKVNEIETLLDGIYLLGELPKKTEDIILSAGELISSQIIYEKLKELGSDVSYKDSRELIKTDSNFGAANVNFELSNYLIQYFFERCQSKIIILPGFISQDANENTTTLGRGGSDYSAAIIAAALKAEQLEIWTDVSGMYTCNPKIVQNASPIAHISYKEAMELSHFGAKVLYAPTIQPVMHQEIPMYIKNTFEPKADGTLINNEISKSNQIITGISHIENIALITLEGAGLVGISGSAKRLFTALAKENLNIIFITQASSEHSICVGLMEQDAIIAKQVINAEFSNEIKLSKVKPISIEANLSVIAVVGENMKRHQGISGKIFSTLGNNNVNIRAITQGSSERNISVVIENKDASKALNCLHEHFFEEQIKEINLFVLGAGNVGSKLLEQIHKQNDYLKKNLKMSLRVIGLSNTKNMHFDYNGIALDNWDTTLSNGIPSNQDDFIDHALKLNLRNSVLLDNTASGEVAKLYSKSLSNNIAVVTCNKIACSSKLSNYKELKELSKKYNAPFLFETNVGAGLPIIDTLKNIVASGDTVHKIQAVLSGSLNFIFNNYDGNTSFASVVEQAKIEGYTEPDPKIDLSGVDVMRKIVILIRESGYAVEIDDIQNVSFLPQSCIATESVDDFFEALKKEESHFSQLLQQAKLQNSRLKYVAEFENGKAKVGLQFIPENHPFYHLEGKDNIVLFYTQRYNEQPLLIKGAGAGAEVTASGLFADIIRVANAF
ncbi:MAG: bifunctional aspartate kinase/homoserine dehydrogenase I [Limnohabitans sp.]|nr:bifunctional aspartate kinase/homoserine dehydrogenase I [Limnohabitans sp.]